MDETGPKFFEQTNEDKRFLSSFHPRSQCTVKTEIQSKQICLPVSVNTSRVISVTLLRINYFHEDVLVSASSSKLKSVLV